MNIYIMKSKSKHLHTIRKLICCYFVCNCPVFKTPRVFIMAWHLKSVNVRNKSSKLLATDRLPFPPFKLISSNCYFVYGIGFSNNSHQTIGSKDNSHRTIPTINYSQSKEFPPITTTTSDNSHLVQLPTPNSTHSRQSPLGKVQHGQLPPKIIPTRIYPTRNFFQVNVESYVRVVLKLWWLNATSSVREFFAVGHFAVE